MKCWKFWMEKYDMATKEKKHGSMEPKQDLLVAVVRKFYTILWNPKNNDPALEKALKRPKRCHEKVLSHDLSEGDQPHKKRFCENGAAKKNQSARSKRSYDWMVHWCHRDTQMSTSNKNVPAKALEGLFWVA